MSRARESLGLPFLLSRRSGDPHPQSTESPHLLQPCEVLGLTIAELDTALREWLSPVSESAQQLPVVCRATGRGMLHVELGTEKGPVVLTEVEPTRATQH